MKLFVPKETAEGETRVAMTPDSVGKLVGLGLEIILEQGLGLAAGHCKTLPSLIGLRGGCPDKIMSIYLLRLYPCPWQPATHPWCEWWSRFLWSKAWGGAGWKGEVGMQQASLGVGHFWKFRSATLGRYTNTRGGGLGSAR